MLVSFQRIAPTLIVHTLIWCVAGLMLFSSPPGLPGRAPDAFYLKQGIVLAVLVVLFYVNLLLAAPRLLFRRRVAAYLLLLLGAVVLVLGIQYQVEKSLHVTQLLDKIRAEGLTATAWHAPHPRLQAEDTSRFLHPFVLLTSLLVLGMGTVVATVQKSQHDAQARQLLEQARLATELSLLKAQINPHFFFNTLNNIYSLTLIDVAQARAALHQLSRMMRYVLYETPANTTQLRQELTFVRDYMELMQLRLTDEVTVTFQLPEPLHNASIAPMLLLPYIENAFKHGVGAGPSRIYVAVRQPTPQTLELEVCNTRHPKQTSLDEGGGIGNINTLRRLELLYAGRYTLTVTECSPQQEYCVHLTLKLA